MSDADDSTTGGQVIDRRTVLAGVSAGTAGLLAGCEELGQSFADTGPTDADDDGGSTASDDGGGSTADGPEPLTGTWETESTADASARVEQGGLDGAALDFSVVQCNRATASAALGEVDDTLRISFDYVTDPEEWYEIPVFRVLVDGEAVYDYQDDEDTSIQTERSTRNTGSVETEVDVEGETVVRFGIRPSDACSNGDHGETLFSVDDLDVSRAGGTTATPTATPADDGNALATTWETDSTSDASATVENGSLQGGELSFSVVQCNEATASGPLGEVDDTLRISFDYVTDPEEWYEIPVFRVLVDGEVVYDYQDDDSTTIRTERATRNTGSVETTVEVDGDVTLRFGIRPSDACSNSDHGETVFEVSNLQVARV